MKCRSFRILAFTEEDTAEKKSFGYELIDLRMGGVITRLDSTRRRLHNYVEGKISRLEELETERIPYFAEGEPAIENHWQRAASGADFTDTIWEKQKIVFIV